VALDPLRGFPPVHHRHREVHQHDGWLVSSDHVERLLAVRGLLDSEACFREHFSVELACVLGVVHHENQRHVAVCGVALFVPPN
jgi:hypothetical protein